MPISQHHTHATVRTTPFMMLHKRQNTLETIETHNNTLAGVEREYKSCLNVSAYTGRAPFGYNTQTYIDCFDCKQHYKYVVLGGDAHCTL